MKVLITGGAGYIGTELAYQLENNPAISEIIIYDNLTRGNYNLFIGRAKFQTTKIHFVHGDLLDTRKLGKTLDRVDTVYHLAAKVSTPFADQHPHEFDQVNHWGTAELVYLTEERPIRQFIYMSSTSVYGASSKEVNIKTSPNPRTFYGISKMRGEDHVRRLFHSDTKTYILRCGNVYGYSKSMRFDSVINKFVFEANTSRQIRIFGDGKQSRSFIHIDRLSPFLSELAAGSLAPDIYNLVESTYSIQDIVSVLLEIYPDMESISVAQNMPMRELKVQPDARLANWFNAHPHDLLSDLTAFRQAFTF